MMHGPMNVKSSNNTSKWQMGFNSAFKWLKWVLKSGYGVLDELICPKIKTSGGSFRKQ
jgi:hypothetical protein